MDPKRPQKTICTITGENADGTYSVNVKGRPFDYPSVAVAGIGKQYSGNKAFLRFNENKKNLPFLPPLLPSSASRVQGAINVTGYSENCRIANYSNKQQSTLSGIAGTSQFDVDGNGASVLRHFTANNVIQRENGQDFIYCITLLKTDHTHRYLTKLDMTGAIVAEVDLGVCGTDDSTVDYAGQTAGGTQYWFYGLNYG